MVLLLHCKARGNRRAAEKRGLLQSKMLKAHFWEERGGLQPGLSLLSFKAEENHGDSKVFVLPLWTAIMGSLLFIRKESGQGQVAIKALQRP